MAEVNEGRDHKSDEGKEGDCEKLELVSTKISKSCAH